MATNKPCRFTTAELRAIQNYLPETERRLLVKIRHYATATIKKLCEEDRLQRNAATVRRIEKLSTVKPT